MKSRRILQLVLCCAPFFIQAQTVVRQFVGNQDLLPLDRGVPQENFPENGPLPLPPKISETPERALEILDYWFGPLPSIDYFPEEQMDIWLDTTPDIDREIRRNFSQDVERAAKGELNDWRNTPRGRLALVLLLDQFPRHIYRNRPQAFMTDAMARGIVLEGLQKGDDQRLYPVERAFFYLPLEHSENLEMQNLSVNKYYQLFLEAPLIMKPPLQEFLRYAILHQQEIARFGRFPHRNVLLGRPSTSEETIYLRVWGKRPS